MLYVEAWRHDQGPNFRPDMNERKTDVVDEAFRQYAIARGLPRVAPPDATCTGDRAWNQQFDCSAAAREGAGRATHV